MRYLDKPNLPDGPVSAVIADGRISRENEEGLLAMGIKIIKTKRHPGVYEAISFHPDIMFHHVGGDRIVYAPETDESVVMQLASLGFHMIQGRSRLGEKYPFDIAYNAARVGRYVFHNFKYTDPVLKEELEKQGGIPVHVKQGYAKCSVSVVREDFMITSDAGIARAASDVGIEVLLIEPEEDLALPGLDYGFIGGSSAMLGKDKWCITGSLENLRQGERIKKALECKGIEAVSLGRGKVEDIGSIIAILQN